jgi:hypothetical protein
MGNPRQLRRGRKGHLQLSVCEKSKRNPGMCRRPVHEDGAAEPGFCADAPEKLFPCRIVEKQLGDIDHGSPAALAGLQGLLPAPDDLLVETFPRAAKYYLVCYPFEGRLAHQTLGMLLTRRLERARMRPLGFVANEYALAVWGLGDVTLHVARGDLSLAQLFDQDMLGDDLEAWLAESAWSRKWMDERFDQARLTSERERIVARGRAQTSGLDGPTT